MAATKALRAEGFSNLIVGVTGNVLDEDVRTFLQAGADCVLGKPVRFSTISSLVRFVRQSGFSSRSRDGCTLIEEGSSFQWVKQE